MTKDFSLFPDPVYRDTVLAPLFDGVKTHYASSMAAINQAHLVMLHNCDILDRSQARSIAKALQAVEDELDLDSLQYTGEHEDYFFLVEAELKQRLGADLGGMLHTARSRNDMDHTVFKMALRERCDKLSGLALALAKVLQLRINQERDTLIVAYTHGQPAQPDTFAHYLAAVLEVLLSDIQRLQAARTLLDLCPMGAAAITTTGFAIDRQSMAELLGFSAPKRNSYGCIASVDYITGLYSAIKLLFVHLGRVVQDMAFWSSFEVGQLQVPDALVQISSIMPQKRNPVPIEHLRHLASITAGRCDMIVNTMHNTPFTDMNDSEGEVQAAGYAAFDSGARVLRLLASFMTAVNINGERVTDNADRACITITELADTLVRQEQLSFRQAHEIAAATASEVIRQGTTLRAGYAAFEYAFEQAAGKATSLDEPAFIRSVSMQQFVAVRERFGGPGKNAMDEAVSHYSQCINDLGKELNEGPERIAVALNKRTRAFNALLEQ
ncbi:MAG: argininosuccinate lyase [Granulosicoccus sp.]